MKGKTSTNNGLALGRANDTGHSRKAGAGAGPRFDRGPDHRRNGRDDIDGTRRPARRWNQPALAPVDASRFERATEALEGAYRIGDPGEPVDDGGPLIAGRVE